jgi:hypothetical protein
LTTWSLAKLEFVLSRVEGLIEEDESAAMKRSLREFEVQTGLGQMKALYEGDPNDPNLTMRVLERLTPFYETGFMFQKSEETWLMTDFFWRGQLFHLTEEDLVAANKLIGDVTPLQVAKTDAKQVLKQLNLEFVRIPKTAQAYLFKPTEKTAYILISDLPDLWSEDHVGQTKDLLNKSFIF